MRRVGQGLLLAGLDACGHQLGIRSLAREGRIAQRPDQRVWRQQLVGTQPQVVRVAGPGVVAMPATMPERTRLRSMYTMQASKVALGLDHDGFER